MKCKVFIVMAILIVAVSGCANQPKEDKNSYFAISNQDTKPSASDVKEKSVYTTGNEDQSTTYNINFYVQGMMNDLTANMDIPSKNMVVGVTSFVYLDGSYNKADLLGNQLSESFMHQLHQFGLTVIDFKVSDYIRVTPVGDFSFTRDFNELTKKLPIHYILGGTLVKQHNGVLVNVRIVSVKSKKILSSAQGFIPLAAIQAFQSSGMGAFDDGLTLKKGSRE